MMGQTDVGDSDDDEYDDDDNSASCMMIRNVIIPKPMEI